MSWFKKDKWITIKEPITQNDIAGIAKLAQENPAKFCADSINQLIKMQKQINELSSQSNAPESTNVAPQAQELLDKMINYETNEMEKKWLGLPSKYDTKAAQQKPQHNPGECYVCDGKPAKQARPGNKNDQEELFILVDPEVHQKCVDLIEEGEAAVKNTICFNELQDRVTKMEIMVKEIDQLKRSNESLVKSVNELKSNSSNVSITKPELFVEFYGPRGNYTMVPAELDEDGNLQVVEQNTPEGKMMWNQCKHIFNLSKRPCNCDK